MSGEGKAGVGTARAVVTFIIIWRSSTILRQLLMARSIARPSGDRALSAPPILADHTRRSRA